MNQFSRSEDPEQRRFVSTTSYAHFPLFFLRARMIHEEEERKAREEEAKRKREEDERRRQKQVCFMRVHVIPTCAFLQGSNRLSRQHGRGTDTTDPRTAC